MSSRRVSDYTFHYHARAMLFEGVWAGTLVTADVVARKAFGASGGWILVLTTAPQLVLFTSLFFSRLARRERSTPRRFLWAGLLGRGILIGVAAVNSAPAFILFITLSAMLQAYLIPAWNAVFQANYAPGDRGRRFGTAAAISALSTILTALLSGLLLDLDREYYRWIFPVAGAAGFLSCYFFSKIRPRRVPARTLETAPAPAGWARSAWREALGILESDGPFRRFEIAYFLYGLVFMLLLPVIPFYFVDELQVDYSQAAQAKGVLFYLMMILFQPLAGRILDRTNPARVSEIAFRILAFFPLPMMLFPSVQVTYACFALFGIGLAFVNLAWTIGPVHFSKDRDSSAYMGIHVTLVSVRALFGNVLGWILLVLLGSRWAFGAPCLFFAAGALVMGRLEREMSRT